jgi:di/tricarboxylate transporter
MITFDATDDASVGAFGYFEFAVAGVPALAGIMAITLLFGKRLLPERSGSSLPADFSAHTWTLVEQYRLEDELHRLRVRSTSPYVGAPRSDFDLKDYPGVSLVAIQEGGDVRPLARPLLKEAIAILAVLVGLLATNVVPPAIAGLVCACAMVMFGVLTVPQAYKGVDWTSCILIGGMIPLSTAMTKIGAADLMAEKLLSLVGDSGPQALLGGLFPLTAILGQLISNTATALIIVPIAVAAATEIGISARPVLMSITVAAASFLTPVATPVNLMVMGPGGYRFGDFWKFGLPCMLWFLVVAVFLVPLYWTF